MGRKGKGKGPPEKDGYAQGGAARGSPPALMTEDSGLAAAAPILWPLTPLGIPRQAPQIPPLPAYALLLPAAVLDPAQVAGGYGGNGGADGGYDIGLFGGGIGVPAVPPLPECLSVAGGAAGGAEAKTAEAAAPDKKQDTWEPVHEIDSRMDRRTFFHTDGRTHASHNNASRPKGHKQTWDIGERLRLKVEEIHFGNARAGIMGKPADMPVMLKWTQEEFDVQSLEVAQIHFGNYWVWCTVGIPSQRIIYAAKRSSILEVNCSVVAPPPVANPDEDIDLTYGASIQGIQLVP
mmetsp:Transcript_131643/g.421144  ORF Transcript_131643/g.421144 Transcript_131643/m.421144 type:complete len:292 (+) Transcript_131643:152-1027(+)